MASVLDVFTNKLKQNKSRCHISDFFLTEDDPNWKKIHPLGPVHFQHRCLICNEIVQRNHEEIYPTQHIALDHLLQHDSEDYSI